MFQFDKNDARSSFAVLFEIYLSKVDNMNWPNFFVVFIIFGGSIAQNLERKCKNPEDISLSRLNRLHHPCESNQNPYFAIETFNDFYCVFYSTLGISLFFAESKFEIKVKGEWEHEQVRK